MHQRNSLVLTLNKQYGHLSDGEVKHFWTYIKTAINIKRYCNFKGSGISQNAQIFQTSRISLFHYPNANASASTLFLGFSPHVTICDFNYDFFKNHLAIFPLFHDFPLFDIVLFAIFCLVSHELT